MPEFSTIITVTLNPAVDKVLVVPNFAVGKHVRAESRSYLAAGKGINVARGIARLGGRAGVCAFMGQANERMFRQSLQLDGIDGRLCQVRGRVRTNTTILDPLARTTTHVREPGFEVTQEDLAHICTELADWMAELPPHPTLAFAGSLPPSVSAADFTAVLGAAAVGGARIVLDTHGQALRAAIRSGMVDTVKPNLDELSEYLERSVDPADVRDAAREMFEHVNTVLVTMGETGAWLVRKDIVIGRRCPVAASEVRNTVGCGDAFLAGWLLGGQMSADPERMLSWAVSAGAASAMSESSVGYTIADVEALLLRCEDIE